jgi:limonene-1,2-epoxide hydrolase
MSTVERNENVVREMIAGWEAKDAAAIRNTFASEIVWHNMPMDPINGLDAVMAMAEPFLAACDLVEWKILQLQGVGNRVYTERVDCFELGGNRLEVPVAGAFDLNVDGKITSWRDYFDMQTWLDQGGPPFG